ncbi:MAG: thioesterase family protein [Aeromicrobium sp.]
MSRIVLPTAEQLDALPVTYDAEVPPAYLDDNGHMNVQFYLAIATTSFADTLADMGFDDSYLADDRMSTFSIEHHVRYLAELRLGDRIVVHGQVLDRSDRGLHLMTYIVNGTSGRLACTIEATVLNVSLDSRGTTPFPDHVRDRVDAMIEKTRSEWPAPVCGVMGFGER